jgi:hypothetical protein
VLGIGAERGMHCPADGSAAKSPPWEKLGSACRRNPNVLTQRFAATYQGKITAISP